MPYVDHQDGDARNNDPRNLRIVSQPLRQLARALVAESAGNERRQYDPEAVKQYSRLAVIDYATFLKESPYRSPEINGRALERAYLYLEAAIKAGADEEDLETRYRQLRQ